MSGGAARLSLSRCEAFAVFPDEQKSLDDLSLGTNQGPKNAIIEGREVALITKIGAGGVERHPLCIEKKQKYIRRFTGLPIERK